MLWLRRALVVVLVVTATLAGGLGGLTVFRQDRDLSVGSVRLSIDPFHDGALDLYVPVVDWGVRFPAVRAPARISIDVRGIDRDAVQRIAGAGQLDVERVRQEATDELAGYLRLALVFAALSGFALGGLVAVAVRGGKGPRLRWTLGTVGLTTLAGVGLLVITLPPRSGDVDRPEYYANGPEVPSALRALRTLTASSETLDDELEEQLVGIARLVEAPGVREGVQGLPRLTVASDLHNNLLALPALERSARGEPLLFAGDLTDRGSPVERRLVRRIAGAGQPVVFVSGNHDSDLLEHDLARDGAIVLTRRGRLMGDGTRGRIVNRVGGLRVAGYDDPLKRRVAERYRDRGADYTTAMAQDFSRWLERLRGRVDVVMVHAPALLAVARVRLRLDPFPTPLLLVAGHTHTPDLEHAGSLTVLNPGSVGAGGTGNLAEGGGRIGIAAYTYRLRGRMEPLAADLVEIDPGTGSATAERFRLDAAAGDF